MPAFQLNRLQAQLKELAAKFYYPTDFKRALHSLLQRYADMAYRPGLEVQQAALIPSYQVNPLVLRYLEQELSNLCQQDANAALALADVLWKDSYLQPRLAAVFILGRVALNPPEPVLERLTAWAQPQEHSQVLEALFQSGSMRLRTEMPERWLALLDDWINRKDESYRNMGLRSLLSVIRDEEFQNIPPVFRMLNLVLQKISEPLSPNLVTVLEELAKRVPGETAFFLRQQIANAAPNVALQRLARRCLPFLSPEEQESLRSIL